MKRFVAMPAMAVCLAASSYAGAEAPLPGKKPIPDYDGRRPAPATGGDVALWVPRILLSPLYFVSEYVIRLPLSVVIPAAERVELPRKLYDFFAFGPDHKAGIAPVGFLDFGFNPSVGIYAFWNDAGFSGDDWHIHAEAWPGNWIGVSLTDRIRLDSRRKVQFRVEGLQRPDHVFYGLGPDTQQSSQSRYGEDRVDAAALYEWRFWRSSRIQTSAGLRAVQVYDGHYGLDPSLEQEAATGAFAIPYGFRAPYTAEINRLLVGIDTRQPSSDSTAGKGPESGSGVRIEATAEQGSDVRASPASGWVRYRASAGTYVDLNQNGRVLALIITTLFADPLGTRPVPFTELATLGGDSPMRGYFPGRLVGRSALVASMHYVWPIAPWLGGNIESAAGNVFDEHLQGFRVRRLRFSGDVGLSSARVRDYPIEALFGLGSETFEHGGRIDSVRVNLSVNHDF